MKYYVIKDKSRDFYVMHSGYTYGTTNSIQSALKFETKELAEEYIQCNDYINNESFNIIGVG